MNTIEVLKEIIKRNSTIALLSFHSFPPSVMIQDEISDWSEREQKVFERALELKRVFHLPFWSGVMLSSFNNNGFSESILSAALHHNPIRNLSYIDVDKVPEEVDRSCALCSRVILKDGTERHIPMIDFHVPPSPENLIIVQSVCRLLGLHPGWILNSGESYHYIGALVVSWESLYDVLSKALVFNPIVDIAWISHQLREKSCSLRVGEKKGRIPIVEMEIE